MSKRFEWHSYYKRMVLDTKTNKIIKVIDTLNKQDQRIAEQEEQLKNAVILKPDRYVIVSNGWKKRVWGIAKIQQEVCDNFIYCSDNYIGCYSPFWQYGEFDTKEEAQAKLKELQGK